MEFDQAVAELDLLVSTLERDGDERALELLQLMDAIHRPAFECLLAGDLDNPIAVAVLSMYDLVPLDDRTQVEEALDEIRPYIESHGGALELLDVEGGTVHLQLSGSCHGCAASAMTLRRGIETKLREKIAWFEEIVAHDPDEAPEESNGAFQLPMVQFDPGSAKPAPPAEPEQRAAPDPDELARIAQLRRPVFEDVGLIAELPPGEKTVADVDGVEILVLNVDGEPYAFRNVCTFDGRSPLNGGRLTGTVLVCPWHNCAYDIRSGRRVDEEEGRLAVLPVAEADGTVKVAVNVA